MHKEDIKAALRKAFTSLAAFETAKRLPTGSVKDVLRGRRSAATEKAIAAALNLKLHTVFPASYPPPLAGASSTIRDDSTPDRTIHRLSGTRA